MENFSNPFFDDEQENPNANSNQIESQDQGMPR